MVANNWWNIYGQIFLFGSAFVAIYLICIWLVVAFIDNLLNNDFLKIIPDWFNILITILGLAFVFLISKYNSIFKFLIYISLMILTYILASYICFYFCIVINVITPIVVILLGITVAYTNKYLIENKSKEKVKAVMGMYISNDVMEKVLQNIDDLGLGGKKTTATVLFSDIRGFTSLSENMTAQEVSELLNEYFSAHGDKISASHIVSETEMYTGVSEIYFKNQTEVTLKDLEEFTFAFPFPAENDMQSAMAAESWKNIADEKGVKLKYINLQGYDDTIFEMARHKKIAVTTTHIPTAKYEGIKFLRISDWTGGTNLYYLRCPSNKTVALRLLEKCVNEYKKGIHDSK